MLILPHAQARQGNRLSWPIVIGWHGFKEVQHTLRTIRGPCGKQMMIGLLDGATAPYDDKPGSRFLVKIICLPSLPLTLAGADGGGSDFNCYVRAQRCFCG